MDKETIVYFLEYVLLRSGKYVENKKQAENLTIYALTALYILAEDSTLSKQPAELIDRLIEIIHPDITQQVSAGNEALFPDEKTRKLAIAMNRLSTIDCQILMLHHIGALNTKEISQIYNTSIPEIRTAIIRSEKELVRHLAPLWPKEPALSEEDVCLWLDELSQAFGLGQKMRITEAVENWLAQPQKARRMVQKYLDAV
jgi:hypothetical protein